ncbi:MAG: pentapeptide repeat-containing protein [Candidatus Scalindua sp.]|nr:pentapeptide repeat-containing protein [Candidatus Scalindua sp.]
MAYKDASPGCNIYISGELKKDGYYWVTAENLRKEIIKDTNTPLKVSKLWVIGKLSIPGNEGELFDIKREISIVSSVFDSDVGFHGLHIKKEISFRDSIFKNSTNFFATNFEKMADFHKSIFYGKTDFSYANFKEGSGFSNAKFANTNKGKSKVIKFFAVKFGKQADFWSTEFYQKVDFTKSHFDEDAQFMRAKFKSDAVFDGTKFRGDTYFSFTEFEGSVFFPNSSFREFGAFHKTKFNGTIQLGWSSHSRLSFTDWSQLAGLLSFDDKKNVNFLSSVTSIIKCRVKFR